MSASFYSGLEYGSLDGTLKQEGSGRLPHGYKLTLTAGGKQIDCFPSRNDTEYLKSFLNVRVVVDGLCTYVGTSPLPIKMDIDRIQIVNPDADLSRWAGSFRPFAIDSWEHDA